MRAFNLLPPEERYGAIGPARTGPTPYVVVGALVLALVAVTFVVMTGNSVTERRAELQSLQQRKTAAEERSARFRSYASFKQVQQQRLATVDSLARSRFDWERPLRELSRLINRRVWLVNVTGTVSPDVQVDNDPSVSLRETVAGPALSIVGCARSQEDVADFVNRVRDIDGVTRVGLNKSDKPDSASVSSSGGGGAAAGADDECRTRDFIAKFEVVASFDEVTVDPAAPMDPPDDSTGEQSRANGERQQVSDAAAKSSRATKLLPGNGK